MRKEENLLKIYVSPTIKIEEVNLESGLANGSVIIVPGDETGIVLIDEWTDGGNENSTEGDSRW